MGAADGARGALEQQSRRRARFETAPHAVPQRRPPAGADDRHELLAALLEDPDALAHLAHLADLRNACVARPHWPGSIPRYWAAVERSPLRERLVWSELDDLVSMSRTPPATGPRERVVRGRR